MPEKTWRQDLSQLLHDAHCGAPAATKIFVLAAPRLGINPHFPPYLAHIVDRHVERLNTTTVRLLRAYPNTVFVPESADYALELESASLYRQWAEGIADRIARNLDPARSSPADTHQVNETTRQQALKHLEATGRGRGAPMDAFAKKARDLFGTTIAAITFIRSDTQIAASATGMAPTVIAREESFCDLTIRRTGHFVIHDAALDSRYAHYDIVTGTPHVRFYAGYPIESPDGHRIGAICIMDPEPRTFTHEDATALRDLAHHIQNHLYH